jgi:NitT/TauT family transport system substrate-binding protein
VPNRFSNQRLLIFRALKNAGMTPKDVDLVEMPPPDMSAALYAKAVDAISSGEPFVAQTELDGYGRVLWLTKDVWPNFISFRRPRQRARPRQASPTTLKKRCNLQIAS